MPDRFNYLCTSVLRTDTSLQSSDQDPRQYETVLILPLSLQQKVDYEPKIASASCENIVFNTYRVYSGLPSLELYPPSTLQRGRLPHRGAALAVWSWPTVHFRFCLFMGDKRGLGWLPEVRGVCRSQRRQQLVYGPP